MDSFAELVTQTMRSENWEPTKTTRLRSVREMKYGAEYVRHRFPFKGGVPYGVLLTTNIQRANPLFEMFKGKSLKP